MNLWDGPLDHTLWVSDSWGVVFNCEEQAHIQVGHTHTNNHNCAVTVGVNSVPYTSHIQLDKKNIVIDCCLLWSSRCVCAHVFVFILVSYILYVFSICAVEKAVYPLLSPRGSWWIGWLWMAADAFNFISSLMTWPGGQNHISTNSKPLLNLRGKIFKRNSRLRGFLLKWRPWKFAAQRQTRLHCNFLTIFNSLI